MSDNNFNNPAADESEAQRRMMYEEPYVQRTQEFFFLVKETYGANSQQFITFKEKINQVYE